MGGGFGAHELRKLAPVHSSEARVESAPARDAVDVDGDVAARELLELLPRERQGRLDLTEDAEVPRREIRARHRAGMKHGPLLRQVLARGQA